MSLQAFITGENKFRTTFPHPSRPVLHDAKNLTEQEKTTVAELLSTALSPESLTCDGELRGAKLQAKANRLHKAKTELEAMGVTVPAY